MSTDNKPSKNEDEYFLLQDQELIKANRAKLDSERTATKRKEHLHKCPKCGGDLQEQEFDHVRVDRCPECKGMWLDAGELEMITKVKDSHIGGFLKDIFKGLGSK